MKRKREAAAAADEEITVKSTAAAAAAADGEIKAATNVRSSPGVVCNDDVIRNIFARLPARDAIASMVLSTHHRSLITSPDFRRLHCLHGEPLPRPHIAYVATAQIVTHRDTYGRVKSLEDWAEKRAGRGGTGAFACVSRYNAESDRSSMYRGFHVAGAGRRHGINPMRALVGRKYIDHKYIGTCNGVILFADEADGLLINPAVADGEREFDVVPSTSTPCEEEEEDTEYHISGFGYGPRTRSYKLLVCKHKRIQNYETHVPGRPNVRISTYGRGPMYSWRADALVVYTLGSTAPEEKPRTVLAELDNDTIRRRSIYMDGTVYLINADKATVLAFDVDDETITSIDLPVERVEGGKPGSLIKSELMEMYGHVCVATVQDSDEGHIGVWLLTADRRWERRCVFHNDWCWPATVAGVWDCGGVLLIAVQAYGKSHIFLYDDATEKAYRLNPPPNASPEKMDLYHIFWGYKTTLVSPGSIAGELSQDEQRRRALAADVLAVVKPVNEMYKRKGQKGALHIVCFMEFLVSVMRRLPSELHNGIVDMDEFY